MDASLHDPGGPGVVARRLGAMLFVASQMAQEGADIALEPFGLTVRQWALLRYVRHLEDPAGHNPAIALSQQAIGETLRVDRTTMVGLVDALEQRGLVRRERNPGDRRAHLLRITPAGAKLEERAEKALDAAAEEFYSPLSGAERRKLGDLLLRLVERSG